jgi:glycosyltransferase involved in cell wall biosynthesis
VRILYLADIRFPMERANGIQTFETCYALAERGHAVTLAVRPDVRTPARDPFAFYGRAPHPGLRVRTMPRVPVSLRRGAYLAFASALVATRGADVVLTRDLGLCALLLRWPRSLRPAIAYESHGYAPAVSQALPQLLGAARAPTPAKLARLAARERQVWLGAEAYACLTHALADELTGRFGPRPRLAVVPDGARVDPVRTPTAAPGVEPYLATYAGHLYPWKGVDVFVDAIARTPTLRAEIVGGHPEEPDLVRLQHRAATLGIADRIRFTGMVAHGEVAARLAAADVLVLPNTATTISERYTSPLKLFEYLAAGRPIVASDLPALREIVTHDADAWLVPPGDPSALADGLRRVTSDRGLAARLGERAWTRASAYTWKRRAETLEALLVGVAG